MLIEESFNSKMKSLSVENKIAVAVSGGADSMALLVLLYNYACVNNITLVVLTVDHQIRSESQQESQYVCEFAQSLMLECHVLVWYDPKNNQSHARNARYKLLTEWCKLHEIKQLLLAHHKDDQAETVLMRLIRGSGIDGLCGINEVHYNNGVELIRPLLSYSKQQLINYLVHNKIQWIEDPSNQNLKYDRSIIRNHIGSYTNPELLISRINLTACHMQRTRQAIKFYTKQAISTYVVENKFGYVDIDIDAFDKLPEEIAMRVLLACITIIGGKIYKPRYKSFEYLFSKIMNNNFIKVCTLNGCKIIKAKNNFISIKREENAILTQEIVAYPGEPVVWDCRFRCVVSFISTISKNNEGSDIEKTLPIFKINDYEIIKPFTSTKCDLQFIFSELLLSVL